MHRRHAPALTVAALLPFLLAGCGDADSGSDDAVPSATAEDEVRALGEAYLEALRTGDGAICDRMSEDFAKQVARRGGARTCEETVEIYADWYADTPGEWEKEFGTEVRLAQVDGDIATLTLADEAGRGGQSLMLVREGDAWLIDSLGKSSLVASPVPLDE